jgi:hypothetical protein
MKPKLYLESTIPSYLSSWLSRDIIVAGHQQITQEWWNTRSSDFELYISQFVLDEIALGDPIQAKRRMIEVKGIPLLGITDEVSILADDLIKSGVIPKKAATDSAHIALAAVHRMDFLLTWNCTHIANAAIIRKIERICQEDRYTSPVICTPEELL